MSSPLPQLPANELHPYAHSDPGVSPHTDQVSIGYPASEGPQFPRGPNDFYKPGGIRPYEDTGRPDDFYKPGGIRPYEDTGRPDEFYNEPRGVPRRPYEDRPDEFYNGPDEFYNEPRGVPREPYEQEREWGVPPGPDRDPYGSSGVPRSPYGREYPDNMWGGDGSEESDAQSIAYSSTPAPSGQGSASGSSSESQSDASYESNEAFTPIVLGHLFRTSSGPRKTITDVLADIHSVLLDISQKLK